jgi:hypothetical protein
VLNPFPDSLKSLHVTLEAASHFSFAVCGTELQFLGPRVRALHIADPAVANRRAVIATDPATSSASNRPESFGSISDHLFRNKIHATVPQNTTAVPHKVNTTRCGDDLTVGTTALSKIFTVGISLASCTFANSYCCVSSSYTVSSIFVRR